jgi:hypothetical protein
MLMDLKVTGQEPAKNEQIPMLSNVSLTSATRFAASI